MALAGLVMLVIGDSQLSGYGVFNNALHDGLVDQGATVHTFGVCGSIPSDWITPQKQFLCGRGERHNREPAQVTMDGKAQGWTLPSLMARYNPNVHRRRAWREPREVRCGAQFAARLDQQ